MTDIALDKLIEETKVGGTAFLYAELAKQRKITTCLWWALTAALTIAGVITHIAWKFGAWKAWWYQ